ncbi:MAG: PD-(D/E)XK nuclease family protein [Candidatus Thermoplasmatota archaeon]|nr:PD-(D/E)XK nuclease family protein [Candidatus Thermoplasmatota archaeon]
MSPSSWNRFEECPRKYWLSRQGLPRKVSMPASMGNAIHNSVEDMCNLDLTGKDDEETGWLPLTAKAVLDRHWQIERDLFLEAPRHPRWKSELITKAHDGLVGALNILFAKAHIPPTQLPQVSIGTWREVQEIVLANEATLVSECGRLMGRLDLLISDIQDGKSVGWIVADLKTGNPPKAQLDEKVSRQLRFYRDLLKQNNPDHPQVHAEGWYSANQTIHRAGGPSILDDALEAWEGMSPTEEPLQGTPSDTACAFCEWKAWCPTWWTARRDGELPPGSRFRDEVVRLVRFDEESGAALFERTPPVGDDGELAGSDHRFGAILRDQALEQLRALSSSGFDGALFLGSARVGGKTMHLGDWSEVLPWSPMLRSASQ